MEICQNLEKIRNTNYNFPPHDMWAENNKFSNRFRNGKPFSNRFVGSVSIAAASSKFQ